MIIHEIELKNFRQFYGKQSIEFAQGEKNITIVFGDNGKGKTGIFRALMYALFGSKYIQQDNTNDTIHLVNLKKLLECEGQPVTSYVKMTFSNNNKLFTIKRSLKAVKTKAGISERDDQVELNLTDENGNFSPEPETDPHKIRSIINKVLNEDIKDFFLFDAEKIDTLAKTDTKVKQEVKTAIFKLLQIENIEKAASILQGLYNKQNRKIVENSKNVDIERKNNEIEQKVEENRANKLLLEKKEENLINCKQEMVELNRKLAENEDIKNLQMRLEKEKEILNSYESRLGDQRKNAINLLIQTAPKLMMHDIFVNTVNYLDQLVSEQESIVPIEVLERSLNTMVCTCCNNDLQLNVHSYNYVHSLKESYKRSYILSFATPIKSMIADSNNQYNDSKTKIFELLRDIKDIKDQRDSKEKDVSDIREEISNRAKAHDNIAELERTYERIEQDADVLKNEIVRLKLLIDEEEKEIDRLQSQLERMMSENESLNFDSKVLAFIKDLHTDIKKISEEFSSDMRNKLMTETTEIFKNLIDKKDKDLVRRIEINDRFEIVIIAWDGTEITQDISQGQRQIVALSFISALAKVAAGESNRISFPLFMDTPFGRISGNNRDHLIRNLPNLTSQWILLLTDTELTSEEELTFKETNKLGVWYRLDQKELYHSVIEPIDLNNTMATRG